MTERQIMYGTAGWAIPRAVAPQFPVQGAGLARYAHEFLATELNSTFRRRHKVMTFERWRDSVPLDFRFAVKMPREITHVAELRGARPLVARFMDDIAGLRDRLGPVLIQLPPSLEVATRRDVAFFRMLRSLHDGDVVCEPRHPSWFTTSADRLFTDYGVARVAADPPRSVGGDEPGGSPSLVYFRLHGSPIMYRSSYGAVRLAALSAKLHLAAERARVWCIFDNTASGAASADALALGHSLASDAAMTCGGFGR